MSLIIKVMNITKKSAKRINMSQKSSKPKERLFTWNLNKTASNLLNVYKKQILSNTNLHENVEYFFFKYAENKEKN